MVNDKKRQLYAEAYGMGDVKVGQTITGRYPNAPAIRPETACVTLPLDVVDLVLEFAQRYVDLADGNIEDVYTDAIRDMDRETVAVRVSLAQGA